MDAAAERRREDLAKVEALCAASGGRLHLISRHGNPPTELTLELSCRTAGSTDYPTRAIERSRLRVSFPGRYPFQAPVVHVAPVTLHPNVYPSGVVCLGFTWLPTERLDLLVKRVARIITFDPSVVNIESPANPGAAAWYVAALERTPTAFPTDSVEFLGGAAAKPKPQWREIPISAPGAGHRTIQCERCPQQLRVPDVPGTQVRCPRCQHIFRVAA